MTSPTGCIRRPYISYGNCVCATGKAELGPQLSALSVLVFGASRSLSELASAEQVRPPTMTRIVAGLERAGLVNRQTTEDKRRIRLEATAKRSKILREGRKRRVESLAHAVTDLPEDDIRELVKLAGLLEKLIRNL